MKNTELRNFKNRPVLWNKGKRNELVRLLLTIGIIPYDSLSMLDGVTRLYSRTLTKMSNEEVVEKIKVKTKKVAIFKNFEKNLDKFIDCYAPGYYGYYTKYGTSKIKEVKRNIPTGKNLEAENKKRLYNTKMDRAYKTAEIQMLLSASCVTIFPDEKPRLDRQEQAIISKPSFYTSLEIKSSTVYKNNNEEIENDMEYAEDDFENYLQSSVKPIARISSRMHGCIVTSERIIAVFNSNNRLLKWSEGTEIDYAYAIRRTLNEIIADSAYENLNDAIVILNKTKLFSSFLSTTENRKDIINCNMFYDNIYALPNEKYSQEFIKMILQEDIQEIIFEKYLTEYYQSEGSESIVCDAYKDNEYILCHYIPNIRRLYSFLNFRLYTDKIKLKLLCLDYQEPYIRENLKSKIDIIVKPTIEFLDEMREVLR